VTGHGWRRDWQLAVLDYAVSRVAKTAYFLFFAGLQGLNLAGGERTGLRHTHARTHARTHTTRARAHTHTRTLHARTRAHARTHTTRYARAHTQHTHARTRTRTRTRQYHQRSGSIWARRPASGPSSAPHIDPPAPAPAQCPPPTCAPHAHTATPRSGAV
jgi:hypothetical protein